MVSIEVGSRPLSSSNFISGPAAWDCRVPVRESAGGASWLTPVLVAHFEFVEWTPGWQLHSRFVLLSDSKDAREVRREG